MNLRTSQEMTTNSPSGVPLSIVASFIGFQTLGKCGQRAGNERTDSAVMREPQRIGGGCGQLRHTSEACFERGIGGI